MNITIWTDFSKRSNSTKQPTAGSGTVVANVYYKESTDLDNPTLVMSNTYRSTVYALIEGRYFFVDKVSQLTKDLVEITFILDYMGTYKTEIGNTSAFILYDDSDTVNYIPDPRVSMKPTCINTKNTVNFLSGQINQTGSYVLTYTGQNGSGVSGLNAGDVNNLLPTDNDINTQWNNITSGAADTKEMLKAVFKYLTSYGSVADNIQSLIWIPFDIIEWGDVDLYLGGWKCGFHRHPITIRHIEWTDNINIPWHYTDERRNYSDVYLTIPFIGTLSFSGSSIFNATSFSIRSVLDKYTGEVASIVSLVSGSNRRIVGTYKFSTACSVNIGVSNGYNIARLMTGLMNMGTSTLLGGSINGINAGLGELSRSGITSTSIGNFDGGITAWAQTKVECAVVTHDTTDTPSNYKAVMGKPKMESYVINTISGYKQCKEASVEIACEENIRNKINATMNSGFFYE